MRKKKDLEGEDFHLFGICQGFELIHYLANGDDKDTLSNNTIYNESRKVLWQVEDPKNDTWLFEDFPEEILTRMGEEGLAYHAHDWVIDKKTYDESPFLNDGRRN